MTTIGTPPAAWGPVVLSSVSNPASALDSSMLRLGLFIAENACARAAFRSAPATTQFTPLTSGFARYAQGVRPEKPSRNRFNKQTPPVQNASIETPHTPPWRVGIH